MLGFSFGTRRRADGWLAVVPHAGRIDLAHVRRAGGGRPEIRLLESFRAGDAPVDALKRLASARKLGGFRCTTLLQPGQYHLSQFESPAVADDERGAALRWRFKDMVDFPVDSASVGVLDIPTEGAANRQAMVYAVVASAAAVGATMRGFDEAGVPIVAIDIPELAQRNVAALFEEENRGLAFLFLDEDGGLLTITYRGELYAVRRMEVSATQLAQADEERRAQLLERVMLELQRTLDNFDRQYSFISVAGMVVAATPDVPQLQPYLSENLYLPVRGMDLAAVCDFPALPELREPARQSQCLAAIGAALRSQDAS